MTFKCYEKKNMDLPLWLCLILFSKDREGAVYHCPEDTDRSRAPVTLPARPSSAPTARPRARMGGSEDL